MPSIGVYSDSQSMWAVLTESCLVATNRAIACQVFLTPFHEIHRQFHQGGNEMICHRRWQALCDQYADDAGVLPVPEWDEVISENSADVFNDYCDMMNDGNSEWELFFDGDIDILAVANHYPMDVDPQDLCDAILHYHPNCKLLILRAADLGAVYVLKSENVEYRGMLAWSTQMGHHLYEDVAAAEEPGDIPTYVLPNDIQWEIQEFERKNPEDQ